MQNKESDILIIGAGLTGLTLAYLMRDKSLKIDILEARNRLGGRILTNYEAGKAPIEKGATWLGKKHSYLVDLLESLGIKTFEQVLGKTAIYEAISTSPHQLVELPPNTDPSYRIAGGSSTLIEVLAQSISATVHLAEVVSAITESAKGLKVKTGSKTFESKLVISTLPPNLFCTNIKVDPALPVSVQEIAQSTHTWMGESIKIGLRYSKPFWRESHLSGTIVSNVGPIPEMYDHSDVADKHYALKGFLNGAYFSLSKAQRLEVVLQQLRKYYGQAVEAFDEYAEMVWQQEPFTYVPYGSHVLPHQNNGHAVYQEAYLNGKLFLAGAETADQFPGYMEGAIRSAAFIAQQLEASI